MLLQGNSSSIAQKSSEIWTVQTDLQPNSFKSDRLLGTQPELKPLYGVSTAVRHTATSTARCPGHSRLK